MVRTSANLALVLIVLLLPQAVQAQPVSPPAFDSLSVRSPRGAMRRAALVPGWGQIYNRQYIKLPFLYAGMGVLLFSGFQASSEYGRYRRAFLYKVFEEQLAEGEVNPHAEFQADYDRIAEELGPVRSAPLESHRDILRRNRDLSILGFGAMWALGILDAYVSAHMSDFDVGEDLSMRLSPTMGNRDAPLLPGIRLSVHW